MILRLIVTLGLIGFAIGAFCGAGPTTSAVSPFGIFFLGLAALVWFAWKPIVGGLSQDAGVWDAFSRNAMSRDGHKTSAGGSRGA
jgi:hypothetical protein